MSAHLSPPPLIFDSAAGEFYHPYTAVDVYPSPPYIRHGEPSVGSYVDAHDASAVAVVSNQEPTSHQYYGDAPAAVISYPAVYAGQSGNRWVQTKSFQPQPDYNLRDAQREAVYYDSGEGSPMSDDLNTAFYDSPTASDASNLAEDYTSYPRNPGQAYYGRPVAVHQPQEYAAEQDAYEPDGGDGDNPLLYEDNSIHFQGTSQAQYQYLPNYPAGYYTEASNVDGGYNASQVYPEDASGGDYPELSSPTYYVDAAYQQTPAQGQVPRGPVRTASPMGHLPYQKPDLQPRSYPEYIARSGYSSANASPLTHAPQAVRSITVQQPQPYYPSQQPTPPTPISIPSHSPPLLEDTPKKPLTLACFFCRKRKIACGSPPPGSRDRTCNQCARRKLQCVYPVGTKRSVRQREVDTTHLVNTNVVHRTTV